MADLLTLNEYKTFANIPVSDTEDDAEIQVLLSAASEVIRSYTDRDFGSPAITEARLFPYAGDGILDIDDASAVTQVAFEVPNSADYTLDSSFWTPMPFRRDDSEVFSYILLPEGFYGGLNVELGFSYNLDTFVSDHGWPGPTVTAKVTADWGWPIVPDDVKLAAYWTIRHWKESSPSDALTAEAIEGYSRAWGVKSGAGSQPSLAIPNRARDILVNYQKTYV
jgi:hypothetical protein